MSDSKKKIEREEEDGEASHDESHEDEQAERDEKHSSDNEEDTADADHKKKKKVHKLSLTATEDFNAKLEKRGVMYIARVPPRMNPTKIKSLLSDFGVVTRVYLVEEDAARRKRRKKASGGSGGKRYVEGWVEWEDKRIAKHVARSLNSTPISLQKRNVHYGDLWNVKYLSKFKWSHLTEKVAYERRVREQKLRVEMMQARRENASYTQLVETGKKLDKIEERKRKRLAKEGKKGDFKLSNLKERRPRQTKPMEEGADKAANRSLLSSLV